MKIEVITAICQVMKQELNHDKMTENNKIVIIKINVCGHIWLKIGRPILENKISGMRHSCCTSLVYASVVLHITGVRLCRVAHHWCTPLSTASSTNP